ncbi:MAG TPA: hypothetical protein VIS99_08770 [Terrimicrobiaceae bacterium]
MSTPKAFIVVALMAFCLIDRAPAVPVTLSGANGSPLTFTLASPVTYHITQTAPFAPTFVFEDIGNVFNGVGFPVTGNITFSIDGGSPIVINTITSGSSQGDVAPPDFLLAAVPFPGVAAGSTIVLSAGTLTTTLPVNEPLPDSGDFGTFIADAATGERISNGAAVPDSLFTLWLALPVAAMLAVARKHRTGCVA